MKIVYLLSYFEILGGQEYYLARQQARQGHDVTVIASDRFYPLSNIRERYLLEGFANSVLDRHPGREQFEGMTVIRLPTTLHYNDFVFIRGVRAVLQELKPDVVFGHEPRTIAPIPGAVAKKKLGYVYMLDVHDFFHKVQNHNALQRFLRYAEYFWWRRFFVDYALKKADSIIAVAPECKTFLVERHHIPPERVEELPLGVETDFFHYDAAGRADVWRTLGYQEKDVVLMFSGYMFRRKALEALIDLLAKAKDLPLRLLLIGETPKDYEAELMEQAKRLGVRDRVHHVGFLPRKELTRYYSAADIGVWPGNNSLVIIEAMACRLPVIMADMQLKHLASHGNGLLMPYADVQVLEQHVRRLVGSAEERRTMGLNGEKAVREHYSYASIAKRLTTMMESLVRRRTSRPGTQRAG